MIPSSTRSKRAFLSIVTRRSDRSCSECQHHRRGGAGRVVPGIGSSYRIFVRPLSAPLLWAGADVRRRWRSLLVLGLLAGITAALAMAAFAGARRTDTALARLDKVTNAPDAIIFASQVHDFHPNWSRLAARPEVAQLAVWDLFFCNIYGQEGGVLFASGGNGWLSSIDKPVVLAGRMFNPKSDDEIVVNDQLALLEGVHIGDVLHVQAYASD